MHTLTIEIRPAPPDALNAKPGTPLAHVYVDGEELIDLLDALPDTPQGYAPLSCREAVGVGGAWLPGSRRFDLGEGRRAIVQCACGDFWCGGVSAEEIREDGRVRWVRLLTGLHHADRYPALAALEFEFDEAQFDAATERARLACIAAGADLAEPTGPFVPGRRLRTTLRFILDLADGDRVEALAMLEQARWPIAEDAPHRDALGVGDLALIHVGRPGTFIGEVEIGPWIPRGDVPTVVALTRVDVWERPVPLEDAIRRIDPTGSNPYVQANAQGFGSGLVRITDAEYEAVLALRDETRRP